MNLKFYKDNIGDWYVDLPDYPGNKEDLQMVCGADAMLDILSENQEEVTLKIEEYFEEATHQLRNPEEEAGGMTYLLEGQNLLIEVWLCDVTKYIFGKFPENLYILKI